VINANQVDHIVPVEDGGAVYDKSNLRAACHVCNTWRAQRQKADSGWRRSEAHIVLVVGPPGAGKSTFVQEHAGARDVIIDYDAISAAIGLPESRGASSDRTNIVKRLRNNLIQQARRGDIKADKVWLISCNPNAEKMFPHHEVLVIDPGQQEVLSRARSCRPMYFQTIIENWYRARQAPIIREW
jgi:GTPase SAR1 family protein